MNRFSRPKLHSSKTQLLNPSRSPLHTPLFTTSRGFTLVEMLVVVTIIGILASLITAAAVAARRRAKIAAIVTEISQLDMACKAYKERFGEYPPDGLDSAATIRHLQKAFPRYTGGMPSFMMSGTTHLLSPMNALVFWLGGMPDPTTGRPIGFSANPLNPFEATSSNRIGPFFEFDPTRMGLARGTTDYGPGTVQSYRYWPSGATNSPQYGSFKYNGYAYLRAENGSYCTSSGAVKYFGEIKPAVDTRIGGTTSSNTAWINPQSCQIFCAGFDCTYVYPTTPTDRLLFPAGTNYATNTYGTTYDDITNFSNGTLEDAMP